MRAIVLEKIGGVENLIERELSKPEIGGNEVLIEVKAISINPIDYKVRQTERVLNFIYGEQRPAIIGWDI
jgi:NADPH:quinone reductase-like Zn-dependent oxidoreductase